MENKSNRSFLALIILLVALVLGQAVSFLAAPDSWKSFITILPKIISMIAFWGPIIALIAAVFVVIGMRLLGFDSIAEIRKESVQDNNPAPAIVFVGTLIASILFLMVVIRP
ncbi:MAG TPA: hypothetical protein VLX61_15140 [Anaerolineales bacterium]|nr:hypothetical protein [Anaerolineales bacterium]